MVVQNYFAWGPPIAGQSRSNRSPADSNRGARLVAVRFSLSYLKRWPSSIHTSGNWEEVT